MTVLVHRVLVRKVLVQGVLVHRTGNDKTPGSLLSRTLGRRAGDEGNLSASLASKDKESLNMIEFLSLDSITIGYIGPGAVFALAGSFLAFFGAMVSAISMLVFWPIKRLFRVLFRKLPPKHTRFKRIVVLYLG